MPCEHANIIFDHDHAEAVDRVHGICPSWASPGAADTGTAATYGQMTRS
jgi:hypothetical protein